MAPVRLQGKTRFKGPEIALIEDLIEENQDDLMRSWDEYFNG